MPIEPSTILIISLAGLGLAGIIGSGMLLMWGLRKWREEQNPPTEQPPQTPKPETSPLPASNASAGLNVFGNFFKRASSGGSGVVNTPGAHEVLRVARDNLTGRLLVEVAGQRFAKLSDIQDAQLAQAVLTTLHDLQEFAGQPEATPPPPSSPLVSAQLPVAATPPTPTPAPVSTPAARPPAPPPSATPTTSAEMPPIPKPSMNPFKQARVLRERAKQLEPIPLKSIPEIIDEHLQQKLLGTPHIWRGIRVRGDAKGAVVFDVDGLTYDAVDAVPDEEVRNIIKSAIAEWDAQR
jgi:hypothetical protein